MAILNCVIHFLVLFLGSLDLVSCEVHYIIPSQTDPCSVDSCLTLSQFADNSASHIDSNTTLFIIGGNHALDRRISVSNVEEFSMLSANDTNSIITCSELANFTFSDIGHIYISGLTFLGCGSNRVNSVDQLTIEHSMFMGQNNSETSIIISESNVNMAETSFLSNTVGGCPSDVRFFKYLQMMPTNPQSSCTIRVGGALIVHHSILAVDDCQFEENRANIGGAIFSAFESSVTINNSVFKFNHATGCDNGLCFGGALFIDGTGLVYIHNSTFQNNTSDQDGGMAVVFNATLSVSQSYAYNNTAARYGGTVAVFQSYALWFETTTFNNNTASLDGGAVYLYGSSATVNDCDFLFNVASRMGGAIVSKDSVGSITLCSSQFFFNSAGTSGGVMSIQQTNAAFIDNCSLSHNSANHDGGVVYIEYNSTATINNSTVINSSALGDGGVVFLDENCTLTISNCNFEHNKANNKGGVISACKQSSTSISSSRFHLTTANRYGGVVHTQDGGHVAVNDCTFDDNHAGIEGGVFSGYNMSTIEVYRSNFDNNRAESSGGVSTIRLDSEFSSNESTFYNNTARVDGAVIYVVEGTNTTITTCSFITNSADYGGVLLALGNNNVTIDNSNFTNNLANTDGGTLYGHEQCIFTISNSFFSKNTASSDGVMLVSDDSSIMLDNNTFSDNVAGHDGGVAYVSDNSNINISNCFLTNNRANDSGGAVYGRKKSTITISNSEVYNCTAEISGGGVYALQESDVIIEASDFTCNSADYGGVVRVYIGSTANIFDCSFSENRGNIEGGVIAAYKSSIVRAQMCNFTLNMASFGGVSFAFKNSSLTFEDNVCLNNTAELGGVTRLLQGNAMIVTRSTFEHNTADDGGVLHFQGSDVTIKASFFDDNSAKFKGGAIYATSKSTITIDTSNFSNNVAEDDGGVIVIYSSSNTGIISSNFINNRAYDSGGVIDLKQQSIISAFNCTFRLSTAGDGGGVIRAESSSIDANYSSFTSNSAAHNGGVVAALSNSSLMVLSSTFECNVANNSGGALYLEEKSRNTVDNSTFQYNIAGENGGAISASMASEINVSECDFSCNTAEMGAALAAMQSSSVSFDNFLFSGTNESQLTASGETQIDNNTAAKYGGGIYLSESELCFRAEINISHNRASTSGGGIHAEYSSITIGSTVHFVSNQAVSGGGVSLASSTLYDTDDVDEDMVYYVTFVLNQADYGGALYVDDESESTVCSSDPYTGVYPDESRCFFQIVSKRLTISYDKNYANSSGHDLFGGLLDRCTIVSDTNSSWLEQRGAAGFEKVSNIRNFDTISSKPVRVCLCKNNEPDCSHQTYMKDVTRGETFTISVAAVDQVNQTVTATIQSRFEDLTLSRSQTVHKIDANCSDIEYLVSFPDVSKPEVYELTIYAEGPCNNTGISNFNVTIHVPDCSCTNGFMQERNTRCVCICDQQDKRFSKYIKNCDPTTESVIREGRFWIMYLNDTYDKNLSSYLIYDYCPLDYCKPPSKAVPINLNLPNGSDAQCANNRGGILCGSCQPNYSLSLGSSKCIECPANWYGLPVGIIIAALFAGIVLVVLVLVLNLTVAVGTLNSIIFYANIIYANRSVYFSQSHSTFVSVFISWVNLDVGFDTCLFEGMNVYAKTWIELAFPVYIIFLVIFIIVISSHSSKFSNLIGKKNPVATLASLILLSYTKLLQIIITSFSFISLKYPNTTTKFLWLPDANFDYDSHKWKFITLFCVAILILILGLLYTILLFSWQWLLHCSRSKFFKWTRNQKFHTFIDTYHTPHTAKHRYWTGLLLLVRVIVYLTSAFTVSIDPRITLLSTAVIICCLFLYKTALIIRVYKNWLLNAMESFVYFNIAAFAITTLYTFDDSGNERKEILQVVVAYISVVATFIVFLFVIIFHLYRCGSAKIYTWSQNTKLGKSFGGYTSYQDRSVGNVYKLLDVIDSPRGGSSYIPPPLQLNEGPTSSVVSLTNCDKIVTSSEVLLVSQWRKSQPMARKGRKLKILLVAEQSHEQNHLIIRS